LRRVQRNAALVAVIAIGIALGIVTRQHSLLVARLLRADPDAPLGDRALLNYAQATGRNAFNDHCASCHGQNLRGDPKRGIPNLIDKDWLYGTGRVSEIERVVLYGIRSGLSKSLDFVSMPAFGTANPYARNKLEPLTPAQIRDVASFLYSYQHPDDIDAATKVRGAAVFQGPGYCYECHSSDAQGDAAVGAPNLTDAIWLYGDGSRPSIEIAIERGLSGYCPGWRSRLSPQVIRAIAIYVRGARF
jgi:cytochrome c oxidase cbb3-type subunit III